MAVSRAPQGASRPDGRFLRHPYERDRSGGYARFMGGSDLDPIEERLQPLAQAIGRAVLGAAALERVLLVDIARRRAASDGLTQRLDRELATLEHKPAGRLLETLRELDIPPYLAGRIDDFIARRNRLVHRFMEDPGVFLAFVTGHGLEPLVERVDRLAADCQALVNELAPAAFSGAERVLGATFDQLLEQVKMADLDEIKDDGLRDQLEMIRNLDANELRSLRRLDG